MLERWHPWYYDFASVFLKGRKEEKGWWWLNEMRYVYPLWNCERKWYFIICTAFLSYLNLLWFVRKSILVVELEFSIMIIRNELVSCIQYHNGIVQNKQGFILSKNFNNVLLKYLLWKLRSNLWSYQCYHCLIAPEICFSTLLLKHDAIQTSKNTH